MNVDISTCQQIQCGAITQAQAGPDLLLGCAEAGYGGSAQGCTSALCQPYMPAMIANGYCNAAPAIGPSTSPVYLPSATSSSPASIVAAATMPTGNIPPQSLLQPLPQMVPNPPLASMPSVCDAFSVWVSQNPLLACCILGASYLLLTHHKW